MESSSSSINISCSSIIISSSSIVVVVVAHCIRISHSLHNFELHMEEWT